MRQRLLGSRTTFRGVIGACTAMVLGVASASALPPFSDMTVREAITASADKEGFVLVKFTAEWCMPCKRMEQTTWRDQRVMDWVETHGFAVSVDLDQHGRLAERQGVRSIPAVIALHNGEELDRVSGFQDLDTFLEWLGRLERGETNKDRVERLIAESPEGREGMSISDRRELLRTLMEERRYDEATAECVWLWENMLEFEPSMYGVRFSFFLSDITELIEAHEPARTAFGEIRDREREKIDNGATSRDVYIDWAHLCEALGDQEQVLEWYLENNDDPRMRERLSYLKSTIRPLLIERDEWELYGQTLGIPGWELGTYVMLLGRNREDPFMRAHTERSFREEASQLYAGYLAARRVQSAHQCAQLLLKHLDSDESRLALVSWALVAEQANEHMLELLEGMESQSVRAERFAARIEERMAADVDTGPTDTE